MKHYITKYTENGKRYAESWLQINIMGKAFCFSKKRIDISVNKITIKRKNDESVANIYIEGGEIIAIKSDEE